MTDVINRIHSWDLGAFWEELYCVTSSGLTSAWDETSNVPVVLWRHVEKIPIHSSISPSAALHFPFMHDHLCAGNAKWISSEVMMTIDHGACGHQRVDLGWTEEVESELSVL